MNQPCFESLGLQIIINSLLYLHKWQNNSIRRRKIQTLGFQRTDKRAHYIQINSSAWSPTVPQYHYKRQQKHTHSLTSAKTRLFVMRESSSQSAAHPRAHRPKAIWHCCVFARRTPFVRRQSQHDTTLSAPPGRRDAANSVISVWFQPVRSDPGVDRVWAARAAG